MIEHIRNKIQAGLFEFWVSGISRGEHPFDTRIWVFCRLTIQIRGYHAPKSALTPRNPKEPEFSKHIQCSYPSRPLLKIVTLYEPNPAQWADFRVRV